MKEIKAIIQPHMLKRVVEALHELPHFPGVTVTDALGQGRGRGAGGEFVSDLDNLFFHRKKVLTVLADDAAATRMVQVIQQAAHTGNPGDGVIFVSAIASVVRIRSGEQQEQAL